MTLKLKTFYFGIILLIFACLFFYFTFDLPYGEIITTAFLNQNLAIIALLYGTIFFIIYYMYLHLTIFSRMDIFIKEIINLQNNIGKIKKIIQIGSSEDEIGLIVKEINDLILISDECLQEKDNKTQLYKDLVHDIPAMVCRFDRDFNLTFVNNTYQEFFGSYEELIGQNWLNRVSESQSVNIKRNVILLSKDNPVSTYRHETINKNGIKIWLQWIDRAIFEEGRLIEYQSIGWDISEQIIYEEHLKEVIEFEKLSKEIVFDLIDIHKTKEEKVIKCLKELLDFLNVDRTYIFEFKNQNKEYFSNTYEMTKIGIKSFKEQLQNLETKDFSWFFAKLNIKEPTVINNIEDLSEQHFKEILLLQGIKSLLIVPISNNSQIDGFLGIDSVIEEREWKEYELNLLSIIGRVIGAIL